MKSPPFHSGSLRIPEQTSHTSQTPTKSRGPRPRPNSHRQEVDGPRITPLSYTGGERRETRRRSLETPDPPTPLTFRTVHVQPLTGENGLRTLSQEPSEVTTRTLLYAFTMCELGLSGLTAVPSDPDVTSTLNFFPSTGSSTFYPSTVPLVVHPLCHRTPSCAAPLPSPSQPLSPVLRNQIPGGLLHDDVSDPDTWAPKGGTSLGPVGQSGVGRRGPWRHLWTRWMSRTLP